MFLQTFFFNHICAERKLAPKSSVCLSLQTDMQMPWTGIALWCRRSVRWPLALCWISLRGRRRAVVCFTFRSNAQIWLRSYRSWREMYRLTSPGWVKLLVSPHILHSVSTWMCIWLENGWIMWNVDFYNLGKQPDAVNFWLGEESAVTSSEFVFICS